MCLRNKKLLAALIIPLFVGVGCSSDDAAVAPSSGFVAVPGSIDGQLVDISGLSFETTSGAMGRTGATGEFTYNTNDAVSFFVGGVKIGEAKAESIMTPLHFLDDANVSTTTTRVTNVTRFLMAIDDDEYSGNGIQVSDAAHVVAGNVTYDYSDLDQVFNINLADSLVGAISQTKDIANPFYNAMTDFTANDATVVLDNIIVGTGPLVVHTTPTYRNNADQNVLPLLNSIDVRFGSAVQTSTVDASSYTVTDGNGSVVDGAIVASGGTGGLTASFRPTNALAVGTTYTVSLLSTILDMNDMPLPADYSFSFTVADAQATPLACVDTNSLNPTVGTAGFSIVNINFAMVDCTGNAITGLDASAFEFFEGFNSDPVFNDDYETYRGYPAAGFINTSTDTVIMIDNSDSVSDAAFIAYIDQAKALVATGLDKNSNLIEGQRVRVYTFDSGNSTAVPYTQDVLVLWDALDLLATTRPPGNPSTSFYGSIGTIAGVLGAPGNAAVKKTLIILSDAIDTSGVSTLSAAVNTIDTNDINVYLLSQNANIASEDALAFNLVATPAEITADIAALKADSVNYIDSLYSFQYSSPKRNGSQDINFTVIGNTNLASADTTISPAFNAGTFTTETAVLRMIDNKQAVVVPTTQPVAVQAVSEFAPSSSSYSWSSDVPTTASVVANNADQTQAVITGVAAGSAVITINDNDNNLFYTLQVYVGTEYKWDFETGSLGSWSAGAGWGVTGIAATDRRNGSDFALSMPSSGGVYPAGVTAGSNLTSPALDLTRFATGAPVLEFDYKLRNADTNDRVVVQVLDNAGNPIGGNLMTISTFTHDWTGSGQISLAPAIANNAAAIRFVFYSDATGQYEGFKVDNVKVYPTM